MSTRTTPTLDQLNAMAHIIEQTQRLFEADINWIRGSEAVNDALKSVAPHSPDAVAWSLTGGLRFEDSAYIAYMRNDDAPEPTEPFPSDLAIEFLEHFATEYVGGPGPVDLEAFNDRQGYSAVLHLLERAGEELACRIVEAEES